MSMHRHVARINISFAGLVMNFTKMSIHDARKLLFGFGGKGKYHFNQSKGMIRRILQ